MNSVQEAHALSVLDNESPTAAPVLKTMEVVVETKPKSKHDIGYSYTPAMNNLFINPDGRGSVEYAKARVAINEDFRTIFEYNQALAKRTRKEAKRAMVQLLGGKVSKNNKEKLIVTFPDNSVARL
jgi:hypothetical protein